MISDPMVMPLLLEMLECLDQEISKVENPPLYVQPRVGTVVDHLLSTAQDECCEGLAWVRPARFFPSSSVFPQPDETPLPKGVTAWAVELELGAVRCMVTPEPNRIPTADEWMALTSAVMDDAAAMRRAVCCFIERSRNARLRNTIIGQWVPAPIEGGCLGGTMTVIVRGPACDCADAGPES